MDTFAAIFLQVVSMSLTSAFVIAAVLLLRLCLKKAPKKFSYALWAIPAFRLVCPVSFAAVFSLFSITSAETVSAAGPVTQMSYLPSVYETVLRYTPALPAGASSPTEPGTPAVAPAPAGLFAAPRLSVVLGVLWLLGIAALVVLAVISYRRTRARVSTAVLLEQNIYECDSIRSPFVLGFFHPKIYIPFGLDQAQKEYILCHESCHIKRFDQLVKPFAFLVLAVHWFNPMVWLGFYFLSKDMEMSCDEKVLGQLGREARRDYSLSLLSFAENRRFPAPNPLAFGETGVKTRVKNIMTFHKTKVWVSALAMLVCIVTAAACTANPAGPNPLSDPPSPPSAPSLSTPTPGPATADTGYAAGIQDEVDEHTAELLRLIFNSPDQKLTELYEKYGTFPPLVASVDPSASPSPAVGIIGSPDGPTNIYVSDDELTKKLGEYYRDRYPSEYFTEEGYEHFISHIASLGFSFVCAEEGDSLLMVTAQRQEAESATREWTVSVKATRTGRISQYFDLAAKVQEKSGKITSMKLDNQVSSLFPFFFTPVDPGQRPTEEESALQEELTLARKEFAQRMQEISALEQALKLAEEELASAAETEKDALELERSKQEQQLKALNKERDYWEEKSVDLDSQLKALKSQLFSLEQPNTEPVPSYPPVSPSPVPLPADSSEN